MDLDTGSKAPCRVLITGKLSSDKSLLLPKAIISVLSELSFKKCASAHFLIDAKHSGTEKVHVVSLVLAVKICVPKLSSA